uniref:Putative hydrolase n=1 Tax=Streptomyces sp. 2238-SVT4 TaxID=681626 RepID=D5MRI7_9ACTN|nr:putative hydrolase [Streptomyces sp. 2238-SVT4]
MTATSGEPRPAVGARVRRIRVSAGDLALSGLLGEPLDAPPRAVVVALHGAGMSAEYFHGRAHQDVSLATLGTLLGFSVLALDRPGYGASAADAPHGRTLDEQAAAVHAAMAWFADRHAVGAGFFLLGHSYGGKVALTAAAQPAGEDLLGVDVSGCGQEYAVPDGLLDDRRSEDWTKNWGALRCYPPSTFTLSKSVVSPVPKQERAEARRWPGRFAQVAAAVRTPVRFTFAEHESWWRHDETAVGDLRARFTSSPRVLVERQPDSGHNISLGWSARSYHLKALGFLEECLASDARRRERALHH